MLDETVIDKPANGDAPKSGSGREKAPPGAAPEDAAPSSAPRQPRAENGRAAAEEDLSESIRGLQHEVLVSLAKPSWLKKQLHRVWKRRHPELLQVYGIIYSNLDEVQRLLTERSADPPRNFDQIQRQLCCLLTEGARQTCAMDIHAAWEFAGSLERAVLLLADDNHVMARLEYEQEREQKKRPGSWSEHLDIGTLEELLKGYKQGDPAGLRGRAVECLALLSRRRTGHERSQRAREEMRADYLNRLGQVLTLLLLLLLQVIYVASAKGEGRFSTSLTEFLWMLFTFNFRFDLSSPAIHEALVALMTGAIGSTLSGFYKLRDEAGGIATLRAFRSAMWAQPFVGATVGVLLMLLINSGVLAIGTTHERLAVYCFLAGFSEPFFLGVVQRVAGAADNRPPAAPVAAAPPAAGQKTP